MSYYAEYIFPCYIFSFCLLGMQVVFTFVAWQKVLKLLKDRIPL